MSRGRRSRAPDVREANAHAASPAAGHRAGVVALLGLPNAGKSSLLNRLVGHKLAIVTPRPQTTRGRLLGILTLPGAQILFVPFCTDERQSYQRVRYCCQARAVENQCYVVMAGNVGNLPNVDNMDIQYAQSCILTP